MTFCFLKYSLINTYTKTSLPTSMPVAIATGMEVGSIKAEVGRKLPVALVHGAGIAVLPLFRASLHTSFFKLPTSELLWS